MMGKRVKDDGSTSAYISAGAATPRRTREVSGSVDADAVEDADDDLDHECDGEDQPEGQLDVGPHLLRVAESLENRVEEAPEGARVVVGDEVRLAGDAGLA